MGKSGLKRKEGKNRVLGRVIVVGYGRGGETVCTFMHVLDIVLLKVLL